MTKNDWLKRRKRTAIFQCMECGRKFYSVSSAERASNWGCPNCNSSDIDIYNPDRKKA